jgi:hypothetical protein
MRVAQFLLESNRNDASRVFAPAEKGERSGKPAHAGIDANDLLIDLNGRHITTR